MPLACKSYDEKSAADPKLKALSSKASARLDAARKRRTRCPMPNVAGKRSASPSSTPDRGQRALQDVRGDLVVSLYNQKDVWPLFGYEGESASKGGYVARGFDDIKWL